MASELAMWTIDRIAGGAVALFALGVIWESRKLPLGSFRAPGPAYMPILLALLLIVFGVLVAVTGGRATKFESVDWKELPHALAILTACVFASLALERLGYRLTVLLVLLFLVKGIERKRWLTAAIFSLAISFGSFYLFYTLLRVPLPLGPWGM